MKSHIINRAEIGQLLQWSNLAIPLTSIRVEFDHGLPAYDLDASQIWAMPVALLLDAANQLDTLSNCLQKLQSAVTQLNQQATVDSEVLEQVNAFNDVMQDPNLYHNFLAFTKKVASSIYKDKLVINDDIKITLTEAEYQKLLNAIYSSINLCLSEVKIEAKQNFEMLTKATDKKSVAIITNVNAMCSLLHISHNIIFTNLMSNCADETTKKQFKLIRILTK